MSNLTQIPLHSFISRFKLSLYLANDQSRVREHFYCLAAHSLNHGHPHQQSLIFSFVVHGREVQS